MFKKAKDFLVFIVSLPFRLILLLPLLVLIGWQLFLMSVDRNTSRIQWYLTKKSVRNKILFGPYRAALKKQLIESYIPWGINKPGDMGIGYRLLEDEDFQGRRKNIRRNLRDRMLLHVKNRIEK